MEKPELNNHFLEPEVTKDEENPIDLSVLIKQKWGRLSKQQWENLLKRYNIINIFQNISNFESDDQDSNRRLFLEAIAARPLKDIIREEITIRELLIILNNIKETISIDGPNELQDLINSLSDDSSVDQSEIFTRIKARSIGELAHIDYADWELEQFIKNIQ